MIQLDIERLEPSHSHKSSYVLILREVGGERKLPIVIGPCNAGSIAIYLESDKDPERPLTHDVIKSITNSFSITISRVVIHTLLEGVFHASFFQYVFQVVSSFFVPMFFITKNSRSTTYGGY